MRYFKYGNSGGISRVIERVCDGSNGYYKTLNDLLESLVYSYNGFSVETFKIISCGFDTRLKNHVYMVLHDIDECKDAYVCYFMED